jgi:DNA modification methylase
MSQFKGYKAAIIQYPDLTQKYLVPALGAADDVLAWCYNSNIPRCFRLVNIYNTKADLEKVRQPYKEYSKKTQRMYDKGYTGARLYDWFSDIQLVKNTSQEKTEHPCQIPDVLAERLITLLTNEGDIVFDPFMGSGTIPMVCKRLNRGYVGCEVDQFYYSIAKRRVENEKIVCHLDTYTDNRIKQTF